MRRLLIAVTSLVAEHGLVDAAGEEEAGTNRESRTDLYTLSSVQFSSVAQSCPTLCDPMNRSTPGLPVQHQLPEFTQTHVHRGSDAIQPSHPLSLLLIHFSRV